MDDLKQILETSLGTILNLIKAGSLSGLLCLIVYCIQINYLPHDISLGDSLYLLLISVTFSILYLTILLCLTSAGLKFSFLWIFIEKSIRKLFKSQNSSITYVKIGNEFWFLALVTPLVPFFFNGTDRFIITLLCAFSSWFCATIWSGLEKIRQEIQHLNKESKSVIQTPQASKDKTKLEIKKKAWFYLCLVMLFYPLVMGQLFGVSDDIITQTFKLIGSRKEQQIIYVQSPYKEIIVDLGILYEQNNHLPNNMVRVKDANILLSNIGGTVVTDLPSKDREFTRLEIPQKYIFIGGR